MPKFYVYTLSYPPQMGGAVFYIGKGSGNRMHEHEKHARKELAYNPGSYETIRSIIERGEHVVATKVFETDNECEAYQEEARAMLRYGMENLTNRRSGGTGKSWHYREDKELLNKAARAVGLSTGTVLSMACDMFLADSRRFVTMARELGVEVPGSYTEVA